MYHDDGSLYFYRFTELLRKRPKHLASKYALCAYELTACATVECDERTARQYQHDTTREGSRTGDT